MNCFPCFGNKNTENNEREEVPVAQTKGASSCQSPVNNVVSTSPLATTQANDQKQSSVAATPAATNDTNEANEAVNGSAHSFTFRELASATKNFKRESLLGESGFGKVYKGTLQNSGQVVAVKQLDRHGTKANKEFLVEVMMLSLLHHPNLVDLIGCCVDGDQRILVYEYMIGGSLKDHLFDITPDRKPLDWFMRMKIASGAAQAMEYLHEKANPQVLCRNLKNTNILLDENFEPKLTDYGLVKLEIDSGTRQRMVGTVGCAPEYEKNGELTPKSDVYSFGIVLLELITGRKALDTSRPIDEQNLVTWAQPYFKDPKRYPELADPQLQGAFPERSLNQAVGVAAMCLQEEQSVRPFISDVVAALSFLTVAPPGGWSPAPPKTDPDTTTNNPPEKIQSSSSSSSFEYEEELEVASSQNDQTEDEDEDEQSAGEFRNNNPEYNEDTGGSSSESLYNEDDYYEDESPQEEMNYRSRSKRPASIKRKVSFQTENSNVSRNSSKRSSKSSKTHLNSSLRKKSTLDRESSSRNFERVESSFNKHMVDIFEDNRFSSESGDSDSKASSRSSMSRSRNQSRSRRSKSNKKSKNGDSSDSSFGSDDGENRRRIVTFNSTRKNLGKSDSEHEQD